MSKMIIPSVQSLIVDVRLLHCPPRFILLSCQIYFWKDEKGLLCVKITQFLRLQKPGKFTENLMFLLLDNRSKVFWTLCLYKRAETVALQTQRKVKQPWPLWDQVNSLLLSLFWISPSWKSKIRVGFPNRWIQGGEPWPAHLCQHLLLWWKYLPHHPLSKGRQRLC